MIGWYACSYMNILFTLGNLSQTTRLNVCVFILNQEFIVFNIWRYFKQYQWHAKPIKIILFLNIFVSTDYKHLVNNSAKNSFAALYMADSAGNTNTAFTFKWGRFYKLPSVILTLLNTHCIFNAITSLTVIYFLFILALHINNLKYFVFI